MYCANYDYHYIDENYFVFPITLECTICLELQKHNSSYIEVPIQLQNSNYTKTCNCNIWIHNSCLEQWYNINYNCPICKKTIYKDYGKIMELIRQIIMFHVCVLFGIIQIIIHIFKLIRIILIILFWYNVFFTVRFILYLPFTFIESAIM